MEPQHDRRGTGARAPAFAALSQIHSNCKAAIQAMHCHAASFEATDWPQVVALYDHLFSVMTTPVVALNRAIAIGETEDPGAALAALDTIASELDNYHLIHAACGTMLRQLGQREAALAVFERAVQLTGTEAEQSFWRSRSKSWLKIR